MHLDAIQCARQGDRFDVAIGEHSDGGRGREHQRPWPRSGGSIVSFLTSAQHLRSQRRAPNRAFDPYRLSASPIATFSRNARRTAVQRAHVAGFPLMTMRMTSAMFLAPSFSMMRAR